MIHRKYKNTFPHVYRHGNLTIKVRNPLSSDEAETFAETALASVAQSKRKLAYVSSDGSQFIKLNRIKRFSKRLRVSLGIAKPFDYYLKELENNIILDAMQIRAPRLLGYFLYSQFGLAQQGGLIFNNMVGKLNAADYIKSEPAHSHSLVASALQLLTELHEKNVFHMDPRLENMMLDPSDGALPYAIDFEHCYIGEPVDKTAMTGMVYGMFFKSGVTAYVEEHQYDALVEAVAGAEMHKPAFQQIYSLAKTRFMERNECRNMFLAGKI